MPAKGIFTLGVGHVRRKTIEPGSRADRPAGMIRTEVVELNDLEWRVLTALKREFTTEEIVRSPWRNRAKDADLPLELFFSVAEDLDRRKIIGRFSTFLEHVKPSTGGIRVTRFNGLFHWAVPRGMEVRAGSEVGRHEILTHCYWREAGPEFGDVISWQLLTELKSSVSLSIKLRSMFTWVRAGYRSHIPTFFGAVGLRSSHRRYRQSNIANGFSDRKCQLESSCSSCESATARSGAFTRQGT